MQYDLLTIQEQSTTLKVEGNEISSRKKSTIQRHGVRRFENNKIFQCSRLGETSVDRLLADTKEWGGTGINHEYGLAPAHSEHREASLFDAKVLESYEEGLQILKSEHPDFIFSGSCVAQNQTKTLQSSYGLDLKTSGGVFNWYYAYQRKGSKNLMDGYFGEGAAVSNIPALIQEHSKLLKMQNHEVPMKNCRMPILMVDSMEPIQKFLESIHISKYEEGSALYSGQIGKKLFNSKITLLDKSYNPHGGHFDFFDGEGIVRQQDLKLIDQGVFASTICDLRFAKKYHKSSTGNGLRNYNTGINISPRSIEFAPGTVSWQKIIGQLDRCLVAIIAAGGDSNELGEFSTPVQMAFVFEKGEVIGIAPQLTIKTSVDRFLDKDLIDVASNGYTPSSSSACLISEVDVFVN